MCIHFNINHNSIKYMLIKAQYKSHSTYGLVYCAFLRFGEEVNISEVLNMSFIQAEMSLCECEKHLMFYKKPCRSQMRASRKASGNGKISFFFLRCPTGESPERGTPSLAPWFIMFVAKWMT